MNYFPIKLRSQLKKSTKTGTGPVFGMNERDDSQLLDTRYAMRIENYWVHGVAKLQKRDGITIDFDTSESDPVSLSEEYVNNFDIIAYGTKVRAYDTVNGTFTDIKTNFSSNNGGFTGGRYGDYFFVNNFLDGLWRISRVLAYTTQTANFTAGLKITGGLSGATAIILQDADSGATGTLTLGSISGTFQNGEIITDTSGGSATVNGVVTFAITYVSGAPNAYKFRIIGKRAILLRLKSNPSGYNYSNADVGVNPPFTSWSTGTGYNDPGTGGARNGGNATDCALIGDIIFVGQENGWYAFRISYTDLAGTSSKFDEEVAARVGFPVWRCIVTDAGIIVMSSSGMWRLLSIGQSNIPYSDQWEHLTDDLGEEFFQDVSMADADIVHDSVRGFMYGACAKGADTNNLVLCVKVNFAISTDIQEIPLVKTGATSFFTGWNLLKFMKRQNDLLATSILDGVRYNLFSGQKDVNAKIHTEYLQELSFGFTTAFNMGEFFCKGELSPISNLTISFDTFDETMYFKERKKVYSWTPQHEYSAGGSGWGKTSFGSSGWGGGGTLSGLIADRTGTNLKLRMLSRIRLRIESDDYGSHIFSWFSADATPIKQSRVRKLIDIT
nr:MAG: hypothetical protein [Podoviridae sp. ctka020]